MDGFDDFARAVNARLNDLMADGECYRVVPPEDIFTNYLLSFPAGTDPMFRQRTSHDCSCCKQFVRGFGLLVKITPEQVYTIWDNYENLQEPYRTVSRHMSELVKQQPIQSIFRTKENGYGAERSVEHANGHVWKHLHGKVKLELKCSDPEAKVGEHRTQRDMLKTMMEVFTLEAFNTVLDLIKDDSIYRGAEHMTATVAARDLKKSYDRAGNKELWLWDHAKSLVSRYKNTVIGTLVNDISTGVPVEDAVKMFESKVAPANYKRPKAVVTEKMIESAFAEIEKLGLETALVRRHAQISDLNINDILFVDAGVRSKMQGSLKDRLLKDVVVLGSKKGMKASDLDIEEFINKTLPEVESMEVLFEGKNINKLVSLTAPADDDVQPIFKWENNFAWSYNGEVTDSIKERVAKAGGNVNAKLRVSLSWFNFDDLDLHVQCPDGHIYYGSPGGERWARQHHILDVDMNVGGAQSRKAVENLSWSVPQDGTYKVWVNQFRVRETKDMGFKIQFNLEGETREFSYPHKVSGDVQCFTFTIKNGTLLSFVLARGMEGGSTHQQDVWGVKTNTFVPIKTMLLSPNHWDESNKTGSKHWFFILKDCVNPEEVRGIYNEFLRSDLEKHRRVFELLGTRTKCAPTPNQLSGLGFTRGRGDRLPVSLTLRSKAKVNYNLVF